VHTTSLRYCLFFSINSFFLFCLSPATISLHILVKFRWEPYHFEDLGWPDFLVFARPPPPQYFCDFRDTPCFDRKIRALSPKFRYGFKVKSASLPFSLFLFFFMLILLKFPKELAPVEVVYDIKKLKIFHFHLDIWTFCLRRILKEHWSFAYIFIN
jgi:hypothetical protein